VFGANDITTRVQLHPRLETLVGMRSAPRPGVAKDGLRDDVERSGFGTMIGSPDTDESFVFVLVVLGVLDDNVPITIFVKDVRVEEFVFADLAIAVETLLRETFVGVLRLRIFVEILHVRVRWSRVLRVSQRNGGIGQSTR